MLNLGLGRKNSDYNILYDAIVIGAGPAGLTAAIYLARARLKTLIIEELIPGGQSATTDDLENYPGFPDGIKGPDLGALMEKQATKFGAEVLYDTVISTSLEGDIKIIKTNNHELKTKTVIIASGASPRKLMIEGAEKFNGKGISYCATCDGPLFRDKDVVIIGGGNSAVDEGLFLLKFVRSLIFLQDLPHLTAEKITQEKIKKHDNVKFYFNNLVTKVNGNEQLESVTVKKTDTGEEFEVKCQGIFVFIGYIPRTDFLDKALNLDRGYIIADKNMKTNLEGVFAAGDVIVKDLRQVATAVGDGAIAGFNITKYLENKEGGN